jgi:hypothetical protein
LGTVSHEKGVESSQLLKRLCENRSTVSHEKGVEKRKKEEWSAEIIREVPHERVLKAQYIKGEWDRLRRFPMKRVLKGTRVPAKPRWMGSSFP